MLILKRVFYYIKFILYYNVDINEVDINEGRLYIIYNILSNILELEFNITSNKRDILYIIYNILLIY